MVGFVQLELWGAWWQTPVYIFPENLDSTLPYSHIEQRLQSQYEESYSNCWGQVLSFKSPSGILVLLPPIVLLRLQSWQSFSLCSCFEFKPGLETQKTKSWLWCINHEHIVGSDNSRCCNTWWNSDGRWTKGNKTCKRTALSVGGSSLTKRVFPPNSDAESLSRLWIKTALWP